MAELVKNRPESPIPSAMRATTTQSTWLRVQQAADVLGVSATTVRRWADSGRLASRRTPSGQRRFLSRRPRGRRAAGRLRDGGTDAASRRCRAALPAAARDEPRAGLHPRPRRGPAVGGATPERGPARSPTATSTGSTATTRWSAWPRPTTASSTAPGWVTSSTSTTGPASGSPSRRGRAVAVSSLDDPRLSETERDDMRPLRPAQLRRACR